jgi:hypothetical protein
LAKAAKSGAQGSHSDQYQSSGNRGDGHSAVFLEDTKRRQAAAPSGWSSLLSAQSLVVRNLQTRRTQGACGRLCV